MNDKNENQIVRRVLPSGEIIHELVQKTGDTIDRLRKIALRYDPKHGDKLYPLEVLGAYHVVYNDLFGWDFSLGNPETFVDNQITEWMQVCDIKKFKNRLERCLHQDEYIKKIFLLRMNYAYLMEEGKDSIAIHRGSTRSLEFYGAVDEFGIAHGDKNSSVDLIKDPASLDHMANSFYSHIEEIRSYKTGTDNNLRGIILAMLTSYGYQVNDDLNEVYRELNEANKKCLEDGLIARIAYLAFEAEFKQRFKSLPSFERPSS